MPSKSLKASVNIGADQVEDAIVYLTDRFLKATKTSCRAVQTPTDFCLVDICKPLIEGWISGQVNYAKGKITLIFRSGELAEEADMIIYSPTRGDRFLYTKPQPWSSPDDQLSLPFDAPALELPDLELSDDATPNADAAPRSNHPLQELINRQAALEKKLDDWLLLHTPSVPWPPPSASTSDTSPPQADGPSSPHVLGLEGAIDELMQPLKDHLTHQIRDNLTAALNPLMQQLHDLQEQIGDLTQRIDELEDLTLSDDLPIPQSREEWLERIEDTWGTVGDYERYSSTYRDANAETPLHEAPDWVALCELDWARELCPALAKLYTLIHSADGIGYEGADILQQFGQHVDPKTGEPYYIYATSGFTAYEALQQIAYNENHSWLPELKNLWAKLASPDHEVFQMFGWDEEAIAALKSLVAQNQSSQRSSGYSWDYRQAWQPASSYDYTLKEYRAILNLGPFTPITIESIKRAYRQAMKMAHPDSGGSTEYAQRVNEAYNAVMRHYFPEAT